MPRCRPIMGISCSTISLIWYAKWVGGGTAPSSRACSARQALYAAAPSSSPLSRQAACTEYVPKQIRQPGTAARRGPHLNISRQLDRACAAASAPGEASPVARPESRRIHPLVASCARTSRFVFIATESTACDAASPVRRCTAALPRRESEQAVPQGAHRERNEHSPGVSRAQSALQRALRLGQHGLCVLTESYQALHPLPVHTLGLRAARHVRAVRRTQAGIGKVPLPEDLRELSGCRSHAGRYGKAGAEQVLSRTKLWSQVAHGLGLFAMEALLFAAALQRMTCAATLTWFTASMF